MKQILVFILISLFLTSCNLFENKKEVLNDNNIVIDKINNDDIIIEENVIEVESNINIEEESIKDNVSNKLKNHFKNIWEKNELNDVDIIKDVEKFVLRFYSSILEKKCDILATSFEDNIYGLNWWNFIDFKQHTNINSREAFCLQTYKTTVNVWKKNPDLDKKYTINDFTEVYWYEIFDSEYIKSNLLTIDKHFKNVDLSLFWEGDFLFIASEKIDSQEFKFDGTFLILIVSQDSWDWKIKAVGWVR